VLSSGLQAEETTMSYTILHRDDLQRDGNTHEFQGYLHDDADVSFILVDMPPGDGPRLHKHPYTEIIIIQQGRGTFTVDSTTLEAMASQIVIIPPDTPHKFFNSGEEPLRQLDIHSSKRFITHWLEE
jgi:mannose-6-phosphate isomerase-like protein (cupin superfamily)